MRTLRLLAVMVLVLPSVLFAQTASPAPAIRAVLDKQVIDWNRGDIETFATGYKNSPDILFIGSKISRGYAQMLDTYRKGYSTKEKMGTLRFTGLEVQPLDERFATPPKKEYQRNQYRRRHCGENSPAADPQR